jgi:putative transposase
VTESFFATLKLEWVHHAKWRTQADAKRAIIEYIEVFYNRQRGHSKNNFLSPTDYEKEAKLTRLAA